MALPGEQGRLAVSTGEDTRPEQSMQRSLSNLHLSFSSLPTSFCWQMMWRGMDHAVPNSSYLAEDHTDGPLSQLNPQAAVSDDAQDASYQQDVQ